MERFRLTGHGKGDKQRPVDKIKFDDNWIRAFGKICTYCAGTGQLIFKSNDVLVSKDICDKCKGIGKVGK